MKYPFSLLIVTLFFVCLWQVGFLSPIWLFVLWAVTMSMCANNEKMRQNRAPYYAIYARMVISMALIFVPLNWFVGYIVGREFLSFWAAFLSCHLAILLVICLGLAAHKGTEQLVVGNSMYQQMKQQGFHYYFDCLPRPFNPDTPIKRDTGLTEPQYTTFVPPANWLFQCPNCGARVAEQICICWNCNYGADGDSTVYYQKFGGNQIPAIVNNPKEPVKPGPFVPMENGE